jgi:DtxR family Mn-dependent transcriptional regulator
MTEAVDDYLKAIYEISGDDSRANTAAIARKLEVAPASVTGMLKKLADDDPAWISYQKRHGAVLTDHGRKRALEVIRHHRLIELYLHDALGYRWDEVHDEAEKLEHAISEQFEDRIAKHLGNPEIDPHGHPIPRKDGSIPKRRDIALSDLNPGDEAVISRVSDRDPEILRYLSTLGIKPGVRITLVERGPFDEPLMLRIEDLDEVKPLGVRVSAEIHVRQAARGKEPK